MVYKVDGNPQLDTCDWSMYSNILNPIQYGLFLKHYSMGGGIIAPLVTLLFLKVEGQNLVGADILMCFLQKWH